MLFCTVTLFVQIKDRDVACRLLPRSFRFTLQQQHYNSHLGCVCYWQTSGVELLMKCVNIPETNDSVVSPAIVSSSYCVHHTASNFFFLIIKVAKSLKAGGENWNPLLPMEDVFQDI